jgi:membrane-bound lytic murein transglycosylase D
MDEEPARESRRQGDDPALTMHRIPLFLTLAALLAAALPAQGQGTPRRPAADTASFGATRPAAGDSIAMAEYGEKEAEPARPGATARNGRAAAAAADTVPERPRSGPYTRAPGNGGPFSVQASGETAARPPRGEVVWVTGRAASDSTRRDTARAGTGQRVASGQPARRDTASATRPARRDTASAATTTARRDTASASASRTRRDTASSTASRPARRDTAASATTTRRDTASATASRTRRDTASATASRTRRDTASATASRPARRDTITIGSRPAARDTAGARRNGQAAGTTGARTGTASTTTTGSTSGRTGSATSTARPRTHTVAAGETFYAIARRYGVTAAQMRAINPDVEMDALEIGDVLRLPASARDSRAGSTSGAASGSTSGSQRTGTQGGAAQRRSHTVAAGETLFGIARRYGVTVEAIRQANELEGDQLRTGQRLTIPPAR